MTVTHNENVVINGTQDTTQLTVKGNPTLQNQPLQIWKTAGDITAAQIKKDGNLLIDGSQNVEQLVVEGHNTQTASLQAWKNSSQTILAQITGDGRLQVGDDLVTPDALIEAHRDSGSTNKPKRGFHSLGRITGAITEIVQWSVHELELIGTGVISTLQTVLRVRLTHNNSSNSSASGEFRAADIEAVQQQGQINILTGIRVAVNKSGGSVTSAYGVKIEDVDAVGTTNNYALHTGKGLIQLGDSLDLKTQSSSPANPLPGFVRVYPKNDNKLYAKTNGGTEYDLTIGSGNQNANTVLSGPVSGAAAQPTFRALVSNDYPTMVGANGTTAGTKGAVPAPAATDNLKFLRGDGTYQAVGSGLTLLASQSIGAVASLGISIPPGYKHLMLMGQTRTNRPGWAADTVQIRVNTDTDSTHYFSSTQLSFGSGSNPVYYDFTGVDGVLIPSGATGPLAPADAAGIWTLTIFNYDDNTNYKYFHFLGYAQWAYSTQNMPNIVGGGMWKVISTKISQLVLLSFNSASFAAPSKYTLYAFN